MTENKPAEEILMFLFVLIAGMNLFINLLRPDGGASR